MFLSSFVRCKILESLMRALLGVVDVIATRREALSKYGFQSFVLPPPHHPVILQRYFVRFCLRVGLLSAIMFGFWRHQVVSAMKQLNVNDRLVIRINSADPNSFMARVSALSRYDPSKHGFTISFLRLSVAAFMFKSSITINRRKNNVGLFAHKNLPVPLLALNYLW